MLKNLQCPKIGPGPQKFAIIDADVGTLDLTSDPKTAFCQDSRPDLLGSSPTTTASLLFVVISTVPSAIIMDTIPDDQTLTNTLENLWANAPAEIREHYIHQSLERVATRQLNIVDIITAEESWFEEEDFLFEELEDEEQQRDEHENEEGYDSDRTLVESDEEIDIIFEVEEDFADNDGLAAMDFMDVEMAEAADLEELLNWGARFNAVPTGEDGQPIVFNFGPFY
ncbi:hypothetical protein BDZ89DRAFT_1035761 [Hymenopellis radicata]|nr:hypothetical protein BDZ89DRAFT_1035761 [Hymenopellis radicata]